MFTEGYAATAGDRWVRPDLADEAIRLGRVVSGLLPREPEALALLALMEFQRSRFAARETASGGAVLLADQDRTRWDRGQIARAVDELRRADAVAAARGLGRGPYALRRRSRSAMRWRRVWRRPIGAGSCCCTRSSVGSRRVRWWS